MKKILERLNELRGTASVTSFANSLGIQQRTLDRYLKGETKLSLELVLTVLSRTGVSADWLLGLSDERAPGGAVTSDARIAELEKKIIRLEGENAALQKALAIVGGHRAQPVKTGGASAAKTA